MSQSEQQFELCIVTHWRLAQSCQGGSEPRPVGAHLLMIRTSSDQLRGIRQAHVAIRLIIVKAFEPGYRIAQTDDEFRVGEVLFVKVYVLFPVEHAGTLQAELDRLRILWLVKPDVELVIRFNEVRNVRRMLHAKFVFVDVRFFRFVEIVLHEGCTGLGKGYDGKVQHPRYVPYHIPIFVDEFLQRRQFHDIVRPGAAAGVKDLDVEIIMHDLGQRRRHDHRQ
mmetsp:Transcript_22652/g.54695  ORF Transcript_22652/g.54695 Transcript_22652/m.54695 type:complete len:223 (-) Transcript_22652:218-886(-)